MNEFEFTSTLIYLDHLVIDLMRHEILEGLDNVIY